MHGDVEDDVAIGLSLETARAIPEITLVSGKSALSVVDTVPRTHPRDELPHFDAVRTDVLDGRRPDETGDAREKLRADPFLLNGMDNEIVPNLACGDRHQGTPTR